MPRAVLLSLFASLTACTTTYEVVDRDPADRTPPSAECDALDEGRCLLPWPSNAFTVADASTATGLRVELGTASLNPRDNASSLRLADGFSRVSPILAYVAAPVEEASLAGGIRLFVAQHDHPDRGREIPLRTETLTLDDGQTLVLADPLEVLPAATDHVVVITDALRREDGAPIARSRAVELALDLVLPESEEEAARVGYHAPTRALLDELAIAPSTVRRVWDFTTRSADGPRRPFEVMREATLAALEAGEIGVEIDRVETRDDPAIAAVVIGRLTNVPTFLDGTDGFVIGADGRPRSNGVTDAPFRVLLPAGEGDYRFLMYGHGTGGNERDDAFDAELAAGGYAKVGVRLYGWTDTDVLLTFGKLQRTISGSFVAASFLVEALAHATMIQRAMVGVLGDALSAEMLGDVVNPVAGRRPDGSIPMWVGGSLGGTTGLIYGAANPDVRYAVVNVPGAAWSQWVWHSTTLELIHAVISTANRDDIDLSIGLTVGQTNLDMADGASWIDLLEAHPTSFLVQESMGDPILPNPGTEMVAIVTGARHVGGVLEPIHGIEPADEVIEGSGITQFRAPPGDMFAVHGFAARGTPAGVAAREQIFDFVSSAFEGSSRIAPPASCPDGCDYGD